MENQLPQKRKAGNTLQELKGQRAKKSNVIKFARVKYVPYVNWKDLYGTQTECAQYYFSCSKRCLRNITRVELKKILDHFLAFETKNEQDTFLQSCLTLKNVGRRQKVRKNDAVIRQTKCIYIIKSGMKQWIVCCKGFMNAFGITADRIK
ncbi:hypothetical protein PGB90_001908 [Kerria lacca]